MSDLFTPGPLCSVGFGNHLGPWLHAINVVIALTTEPQRRKNYRDFCPIKDRERNLRCAAALLVEAFHLSDEEWSRVFASREEGTLKLHLEPHLFIKVACLSPRSWVGSFKLDVCESGSTHLISNKILGMAVTDVSKTQCECRMQ